MSGSRSETRLHQNPAWVPFGGMPAPTHAIVEEMQEKLDMGMRHRRGLSGIFQQMQGLCTTWEFLSTKLKPMVEEFMQRDIDPPAGAHSQEVKDLGPDDFRRRRQIKVWQLQPDDIARVVYVNFFSVVLQNDETRFLLQQHSDAEIAAGETPNPFAKVEMPDPDKAPHVTYPPMTPTIFPVPVALRERLLLDYMTYAATSVHARRSGRKVRPERVKLHKPTTPKQPKRSTDKSRTLRLYHCPHDIPVHSTTIPIWDLLGRPRQMRRLTNARIHEEVEKAGYAKDFGSYWLRYTRASDEQAFYMHSNAQLQGALRDTEADDRDEYILDVVDKSNLVPPEIADLRLQ